MDIFTSVPLLPHPVTATSAQELRDKIRAYKVLFGTDPKVTFRGDIADRRGDTAFLGSGARVSGLSGNRIKLFVDGADEWFDMKDAEKGFRFDIE